MKIGAAIKVFSCVQLFFLFITYLGIYQDAAECGFAVPPATPGDALGMALAGLILWSVFTMFMVANIIFFIIYYKQNKKQKKWPLNPWVVGLFAVSMSLTVLYVPIRAGLTLVGEQIAEQSCPVRSPYTPGGWR